MGTNVTSSRRRRALGRVLIYGGLLFLAAFYLMPLWVMITTSIKHLDEIYAGSIIGLPKEVTYERALPLAKAMHPDTLLAYEMNGEPLPPLHGFPLRLLVPGWYGMTSIKWLVGIHVLDHEFQGFYQKERYMSLNGPGADTYYTYYTTMKVKSIITNPIPAEVPPTKEAKG